MKPAVLALVAALAALATCRLPLHNDTQPPTDAFNSSHSHVKRWNPNEPRASDVEWHSIKCKGEKFWLATILDDREAATLFQNAQGVPQSVQSPWVGHLKDELSTWGYLDASAFYFPPWDEHETAFKALGINPRSALEGGPTVNYNIAHSGNPAAKEPMFRQRYKVGDREYRYTGAYFRFGVNPESGALIAHHRRSPLEAAKLYWSTDSPPRADLPQLAASSDVMWGMWTRQQHDIKHLNFFFALGLVNEQTRRIVRCALDAQQGKLSPWPGTSWSIDKDEAKAILGTPNAQALAYILFQHKGQLGKRTPYKVTIFADDGHMPFANMVWHIGAVPEPPPENPSHPQQGRLDERRLGNETQGQGVVRQHYL